MTAKISLDEKIALYMDCKYHMRWNRVVLEKQHHSTLGKINEEDFDPFGKHWEGIEQKFCELARVWRIETEYLNDKNIHTTYIHEDGGRIGWSSRAEETATKSRQSAFKHFLNRRVVKGYV